MTITKSLAKVEIEHIVAEFFGVDVEKVNLVGSGAQDVRCEIVSADDIRNYRTGKVNENANFR